MKEYPSILDLWQRNVEHHADDVAAIEVRDGQRAELTWGQLGLTADAISKGLIALGCTAAERVVVLARTRIDWVISYSPPMSLIGLFVDFLFMNRIFQNQIEDSLERLKSHLEG